MKQNFLPRKLKLLFAAAIILLPALHDFSQGTQPWSQNVSPLPSPNGFVNDYAGVIDAVTKQQLETKLKNLKETSNPSVEIAVAVVKTTGERAIFDYSLAVARGWKIGSKDDDNPSALLFIAIDDRKYFTQVSKDLEDELPDGVVGNLQRQYLVPEFKKGNYGKGISDTIDAYIAAIRNKGNTAVPGSTPSVGTTDNSGDGLFGIFCCAVIFLVILVVYFARNNRNGPTSGDSDRWGGGGFGSSGGGGSSSALPWIIGGILGSGGSSSSGSGGSSGGGWGGFGGGGDFGGGGAGGDW